MSNTHTEHYQPARSQNIALQHLDAGRKEIVLLSHLLQASLVVERSNPLRRAVAAHRNFVRTLTITIVILLSITIGLLAPQIARLLGMY